MQKAKCRYGREGESTDGSKGNHGGRGDEDTTEMETEGGKKPVGKVTRAAEKEKGWLKVSWLGGNGPGQERETKTWMRENLKNPLRETLKTASLKGKQLKTPWRGYLSASVV